MLYVLGKSTEKPEVHGKMRGHHNLEYAEVDCYLVAQTPEQMLVNINHESYLMPFAWSLYTVFLHYSAYGVGGSVYSFSMCKESPLGNLDTLVYNSFYPNSFPSDKGSEGRPLGVSPICGVSSELPKTNVEEELFNTINMVFMTNFHTNFDMDFLKHPMFDTFKGNAKIPEGQTFGFAHNAGGDYTEYFLNLEKETSDSILQYDWGVSSTLRTVGEYFNIVYDTNLFPLEMSASG